MAKTWDRAHNPEARPLGCNGKYGSSGRGRHKYYGTPVCDACKASDNHYCRELRRGQTYPARNHCHAEPPRPPTSTDSKANA